MAALIFNTVTGKKTQIVISLGNGDGFDKGKVNIGNRDLVKLGVARHKIAVDLYKSEERPKIEIIFVYGLS